MYEPLLFIHSWTRWIVFVSVVYFLIKSAYGWSKMRPWSQSDENFIWAFNLIFGYQLAFGITLWAGLSPMTKAGFKNPSSILENSLLSFWVFRHAFSMIFAFGIFHMGRAKSKTSSEQKRFKIYTVTFAGILVVIVSAIPWPWLSYGRGLFRWF